jgi:glucosyl-3-phosphoglycerate phosphatase
VSVRPDSIPVLQQPFCFLRHGETSSNFEDTIAGSLDVPLTARGIEQSRVAAILLQDRGITSIHSSALRRARDTANCVADSLGLSVNVIAELGERSWGELEGKPRRLRIAGDTPAGGETPEAFRARILQGFAKIRADGLPLIVAHSGVFRVLCGLLRLMPLESRIENARPVLITPVGKDRWQIEAM